jgi:hypothetical protein
MQYVKVISIEIHDMDLESAAAHVEEQVNAALKAASVGHNIVERFEVPPLSAQYSLPIEGSYYDHHYNEKGFLLVMHVKGKLHV